MSGVERVDLPSGRWVEFGQLSAITEKQRRPIRNLIKDLSPAARRMLGGGGDGVVEDDLTKADQGIMYELHDLIGAGVITACSWKSDRLTADEYAELPAADYDFLVDHVSARIPSFLQGTDFDPTPDRSSPTPPSSV